MIFLLAHFCERDGPSVLFTTECVPASVADELLAAPLPSARRAPTCDMCHSFVDGSGVVTRDLDEPLAYVSR